MDEYLTIEEVAQRLKVSQKVIQDWLRAKKIPGTKIGSLWRIGEKDLEAWLESNTQRPGDDKEVIVDGAEKEDISGMDSSTTKTISLGVKTVNQSDKSMLKQLLLENQSMSSQLVPQRETPELVPNSFGDEIVEVAHEAIPIDIILKLKADGMSYPAIAEKLNSLGITTKQGKIWTKSTIENNVRKHKKEKEDII